MLSTSNPNSASGLTAVRPVAAPRLVGTRVILRGADGQVLSNGVVCAWTGAGGGGRWQATVAHLDRAGDLALAYCARGVRNVTVQFPDGRGLPAVIRGTRFVASGSPECVTTGASASRVDFIS